MPAMLWTRWLFLRALGLIFASAFYSLLHQIHGLVGVGGILPAASYLDALAAAAAGPRHIWIAPTVFWLGAGDRALTLVVVTGLVASVLLTLNVWPRLTTAISTIAFLSCVAVLQEFSAYQSDGMLLQAGVASVLLAPRGLRPGLGAGGPPSRASVWLLRWEWFTIYFESGVVKLLSGDPQWRTLTAMDHYYENNPLPTWIGWYVQHLPHGFHAATALLTIVAELLAPWVLLLGRRPRVVVAVAMSLLQVGIIATANYAFLNYLVLALGVLLVDDRSLGAIAALASRWMRGAARAAPRPPRVAASLGVGSGSASVRGVGPPRRSSVAGWVAVATLAVTVYASAAEFVGPVVPRALALPARMLAPFRVANAYGLFAVMTTARYEVEFQGAATRATGDTVWAAYPFRYKPQDPWAAPGVYAPYQPRFDWNLWFASLAPWNDNPWVVIAQTRLLSNDASVLALFADNPFPHAPPNAVRTVLWRYWFTDPATRARTGRWWDRELLGLYAGTVSRRSDGSVGFTAPPDDAVQGPTR